MALSPILNSCQISTSSSAASTYCSQPTCEIFSYGPRQLLLIHVTGLLVSPGTPHHRAGEFLQLTLLTQYRIRGTHPDHPVVQPSPLAGRSSRVNCNYRLVAPVCGSRLLLPPGKHSTTIKRCELALNSKVDLGSPQSGRPYSRQGACLLSCLHVRLSQPHLG